MQADWDSSALLLIMLQLFPGTKRREIQRTHCSLTVNTISVLYVKYSTVIFRCDHMPHDVHLFNDVHSHVCLPGWEEDLLRACMFLLSFYSTKLTVQKRIS